jgi:hypothetical protein
LKVDFTFFTATGVALLVRHVDKRKPAGRVHNYIDKWEKVYAGPKVPYYYRGRDVFRNYNNGGGSANHDFDDTAA